MGLKNLDIKRSYISYGDDNIPKAFLVPALRYAKSYQRSVGFFHPVCFSPLWMELCLCSEMVENSADCKSAVKRRRYSGNQPWI